MNMNRIEVINETKESVDLDSLRSIVDYTLKKEQVENGVINIIIVDNDKIHQINRDYRKVDRPTDVISFALEDDDTFIKLDERILGDIYISIDQVYKQALEYGHSNKREMSFLTVHGTLHLLGYDHQNKDEEKIMFDKQDEILNELDITR